MPFSGSFCMTEITIFCIVLGDSFFEMPGKTFSFVQKTKNQISRGKKEPPTFVFPTSFFGSRLFRLLKQALICTDICTSIDNMLVNIQAVRQTHKQRQEERTIKKDQTGKIREGKYTRTIHSNDGTLVIIDTYGRVRCHRGYPW